MNEACRSILTCEWVILYHVDQSCHITRRPILAALETGKVLTVSYVIHVTCHFMWMSHVVSCGWVMSHHESLNCGGTMETTAFLMASYVNYVTCHLMWMSHVVSCGWVMSHHESSKCSGTMETRTRSLRHPTWIMWLVIWCEWVISCHVDESLSHAVTCGWIICVPYEWVMSNHEAPNFSALSRRKRSLALASHTNSSGLFYRSLFIYM